MGLSNVNFGVRKTGKTGLDRVKQQNSKTKGIYCSPLAAKDLWAMAGNWQESAERTQASQSCAPQDWQSAGFRSLLTPIFLSWAGGDGSPCSQVESVSNAFWRPFALIPELFTVARCFHPSARGHQGRSERAGLWVTCRGPGLLTPQGSGFLHNRQDTRVNRCNKRCPVGLFL